MGVKEEAARNNLRLTNKEILFCDASRKETSEKCALLLRKERKPYGVFLESNRFLMGLLDAAKDKGIFIPNDFRLIDFDSFRPKITHAKDFESLQVLRMPLPIIEQAVPKMRSLISDYLISIFMKETKGRWQIKLWPKLIIL